MKKHSQTVEHKFYKVGFVDPESGVDYHWYAQNYTVLHDHDFYEFIIVTEGKMQHILDDKSLSVSKGTFLLVRPGEYHQFLPKNNLPVKQINFSASPQCLKTLTESVWQDDFFKTLNECELPHVSLSGKELDHVFYLIERINQCPPHSPNTTALIKTILIELILLINDKLHLTNTFIKANQAPPQWLTNFLALLNSPEYFTLKLTDIYPLAPYSQSMLNVYFNKYMGTTLIAHITNLKISYACNLLRYTDESPLEISGKLAYDSLSHFNRVFKKQTGRTPIAYRKEFSSKN